MTAILNLLNPLLSNNLHNYVVVALVVLYALAGIAVAIWPDPTRLAIAKDAGTTLLGVFGIVAGSHTAKSVMGTKDSPAAE